MCVVPSNYSSRSSGNSEANASELLKNREEMCESWTHDYKEFVIKIFTRF